MNHAGFKVCHLDHDGNPQVIDLPGTAEIRLDGPFFAALVSNLARTLDTHGAWVTEYDEERRRVRALAFWFGGKWIDGFEYDITGTPCEKAVDEARLVHVPDRVLELYQGNPDVATLAGMVSYLGVPLLGEQRRVIGHLGVVDVRPLQRDEQMLEGTQEEPPPVAVQ